MPAPLMRLVNAAIFRFFRNRDFAGGRLLMLTTIGARSGETSATTVRQF